MDRNLETEKPLLDASEKGVLIAMLDYHLGNVVVSLPVIEALAAHFEQPPSVIVDERFAPLVKMLKSVGKVYGYPSQSKKRRGVIRNIRPTAMMIALAAKRFKTVIDISGSKRGATLSFATFAKRRIGLTGGRLNNLYTHKFSGSGVHMFDGYCGILGCIGLFGRAGLVALEPPQAATDFVEQALKEKQPNYAAPIAVIHPGAGNDWRRWPVERFAAVGDYAVEKHGMDICLIGTASEQDIVDQVMANMKHSANAFAVNFNLSQLVALFYKSKIIISNESGPTHLAAATDLPIVTIFGPAKEERWRPIREENTTLLRGADCDPRCGRGKCYAQSKCILKLEVETVIKAVESRIIE